MRVGAQLSHMSEQPTPPTPPDPDGLQRHYTGAEVVFTPSIAYLDALVAKIKAERAAGQPRCSPSMSSSSGVL
jgi:hypothetical protein